MSPNAGLVSRAFALFLDVVIVSVGVSLVRVLPGPPLARSVIITLLALAYFAGLWAMTGQTVGALVAGIAVRRRDGGRLSFLHALVRAVLGLGLAPLWVVGLVGVLVDDQRRAWHDRLLRTVVLYHR